MFDCLYPIYIQFIHVFPLKAEFAMVETLSFAYVCLLNLHFWGRSATRTVLFFSDRLPGPRKETDREIRTFQRAVATRPSTKIMGPVNNCQAKIGIPVKNCAELFPSQWEYNRGTLW